MGWEHRRQCWSPRESQLQGQQRAGSCRGRRAGKGASGCGAAEDGVTGGEEAKGPQVDTELTRNHDRSSAGESGSEPGAKSARNERERLGGTGK